MGSGSLLQLDLRPEEPVLAGAYGCGKSEKRTEIVDGRVSKSYGYYKPASEWAVAVARCSRAFFSVAAAGEGWPSPTPDVVRVIRSIVASAAAP